MILSGYLLYYSCKNSHNVKTFFVKRVIRLVPAYWGWLLCIMIYGIATDSFHMRVFDWIRSFTFTTLIIPSTHFEGMWGLGRLSSFFAAYLLYPLVYKKIKTIDKGILIVGALLVLKFFAPIILNIVLTKWPIQSNMDFAGITPLSDFCFFAIGHLAALGEESKEKHKVLFILLALFVFQLRWELGWNIVLSIGVIITVLLYYPIEFPKYIVKVCKILDIYTYPIYICHAAIYALLNKYLHDTKVYGLLFLMLICSAAGAVMLHLAFERPVSIIRKKFRTVKG